ncbi:ATP-binding protein [Streptomyces sp. NBC_01571]|uniref:ATP-binding protein n=1 Tax=Streptomyces sp. NBC_01571 TaxID=2975883 RepID=UPI00225089A5|nr:ATP-binding protein [Streptomyces sp. NBC_01571]MCX4575661.1 ATP-binding protein [Streptomyces sp. NBC_01571]
MTTFTFAPATRETAKARIGIQGPGGSGKTKTALRMAEALAAGGAIGVVDTERGSALKYAPVPGRPDIEAHEFAHLPMAFCSPENLIAAVKAAEEARLAVLIIDSWSHFWAGRGGLLARVDEEAKKAGSGGKFTAWGPVNELEQEMLDALLTFPGHVIVTMRTKNDYEMEGKKVTKVGVKTVQREGAEYEVDVLVDMIAGTGTVTKTRYTALDGASVHHPGEAFAEAILEQLGQGVDPVQVIVDELVADGLTYDRALELYGQAKNRRLLMADLLHPKTGEPAKLGDVIKEYGQAVKPVTTGATTPPGPTSDAEIAADTARAREEMYNAAKAAGLDFDMASARFKAEYGTDAIWGTAEQLRAVASKFVRPTATDQDRAPEPVSPPQMRMMHACFTKVGLGHKDLREQRLRATALIVGRPLSSANELTKGEAQTLLDTLTTWGDRENPADEFAAMVQGLEDDAARAAGDALYVAAAQSV